MNGYLRLTPWARDHLTDEEYVELQAAADVLHCDIGATHSSGGWTVHASGRGCHAAAYHSKGRLAVAMLSVLHDLRMQYDLLDDATDFTPDELAVIQRQSRSAA